MAEGGPVLIFGLAVLGLNYLASRTPGSTSSCSAFGRSVPCTALPLPTLIIGGISVTIGVILMLKGGLVKHTIPLRRQLTASSYANIAMKGTPSMVARITDETILGNLASGEWMDRQSLFTALAIKEPREARYFDSILENLMDKGKIESKIEEKNHYYKKAS